MLNITDNLNSADLVRKNLQMLGMRSATDIEMLVFDETDSAGWMIGSAKTPRGVNIVAVKGKKAFGLVYMEGTTFREHYDLERYWRADKGKVVCEVSDLDALDDAYFAAATPGVADDVTSVEMDQFYYNGGFLRLECSAELPAKTMAAALCAAWGVLKKDADRVCT